MGSEKITAIWQSGSYFKRRRERERERVRKGTERKLKTSSSFELTMN
jgi:hypothetical protein